MPNSDLLKIALEDARARSTALLQLIFLTDRQAMALFRLYVTIGMAGLSAGVAVLNGSLATASRAIAFATILKSNQLWTLRRHKRATPPQALRCSALTLDSEVGAGKAKT